MSPSLSALLYLQKRIIVNWLRRSMRSPFFWVVAAFLGFMVVAQIAAVIDGPDPADAPAWVDISYVTTGAAIAVLASILIGLWRGTTNTPGASLADVVIMMGSPISSRLQFGLLMARPSVVNALVIGAWAVVAGGVIILGIDDNWIAIRLLFSVMFIVLLSEFLRNAVWVGTEQVVAQAPETGYRLRRGIRFIVTASTVVLGWILFQPVLAGDASDDWRATLETVMERSDMLTAVPPMSLIVSVLTSGSASLLSGIALLTILAGVVALALYWARDFVEPIAVTAEHKTDARGQIMEAGSDIQWAVLAQYGVSPRLSLSLPTFGRGPWALVWGGAVRWLRYTLSAAWLSLIIYGVFGLVVAIAVHINWFTVEIAWGVVLLFPFFGSVNMFMDELRRPFIFLIPGSAWARLLAGAITSILDGLISGSLMIVFLLAFGVIPLSHGAGLLLLSLTIALLAQASLALVQVLLPVWIGQRIRVSITFGATGAAFLPALLVLIFVYIAVSPFASLLAAAGVTAITGIGILIAAALMFERIEYAG